MGKKKRTSTGEGAKSSVQFPKDALQRIELGDAFAEYDSILDRPDMFVSTPAIRAAVDKTSSKCFFVGRRGTGKTAITRYVLGRDKYSIQIHPQSLAPMNFPFRDGELADTHQRPFRSLIKAWGRALLSEVLCSWVDVHHVHEEKLPDILQRELRLSKNLDFDVRLLQSLDSLASPLRARNDQTWLRQMAHTKTLSENLRAFGESEGLGFTLLIDQIDEAWDGSDDAVRMLMALMHACTEIRSQTKCVRTLVFLRENVFDRVRLIDSESSRLETCIVSMDWTEEQLLEMVQRRMNAPFVSRLSVTGETWQYFFEDAENQTSQAMVFDYCQRRPRDVLTYCVFAIENARSRHHQRISVDDLLGARRRFSESRLKDLGDEYAENYPLVSLVLSRFYGLGTQFTLKGIDDFLKKVLADDEVKLHCGSWIYHHSAPELFVRLLYNIGFIGLRSGSEINALFRSLGPSSTTPPAVTDNTTLVIHPSYTAALDLTNRLIDSLGLDVSWQRAGLVAELPDGLDLGNYTGRLADLAEQIRLLPRGTANAAKWEEIVGDILRLCFYRWLTNLEQKSRDADGRVIRDWIASNTALTGFWEMVRMKFGATQVIWECKNYDNLKADDFQQAAYYMNDRVGRFAVIAFRGDEVKNFYYDHVKRIAAEKNAMVLLITEKDLQVFVRQAKNGKNSDLHIRSIFDKIERKIS